MGCGSPEPDPVPPTVPVSQSRRQIPRLNNNRRPAGRVEGTGDISEIAESQLREMEAKVISRILEGQSVGEGIKRTPAYETNLTETEFHEAQELFWNTRVQGNTTTWRLLKLVCETDPCISLRELTKLATGLALATEHGVTLHNGGIRICYGPTGELYCLPIYVINPPLKYGNMKNEAEEDAKVEAENLTLKIKQFGKEVDVEINIENVKKGKDLKKCFLEKIGKVDNRIRLFCIGQEIEDNTPLYRYNLSNNFVMISQLMR